MKFREANKVDRKSGESPLKGLSFSLSCHRHRLIVAERSRHKIDYT